MSQPRALRLALPLALIPAALTLRAEDLAPRLMTYKTVTGAELKAHVFEPATPATGPRAAIVIFHGGGWSAGDGTWVYASARRYAKLGMVAVAIDYRLSDEKAVTPLDAMEDARDAMRWVRAQTGALRVDPHRVAAYGISAGGHLAASEALIGVNGAVPDPAARPDALVLYSPAVAIADSEWARKLLLGKAQPETISPDRFVKAGLPPTFIIQGDEDTETPAGGAASFARRMQAAGNVCEVRRYAGLGHLLTRNLDEQEWAFDPDPVARADAWHAEEAFLASRGFLAPQAPAPERPETVVRSLTEAFNARDLDAVLRRVAEDAEWIQTDGDQTRVILRGREAIKAAVTAQFKKDPSDRRELHMLTPNGAFVSVRERAVEKAGTDEERSSNALSVFEVEDGRVRRVWSFPAQP